MCYIGEGGHHQRHQEIPGASSQVSADLGLLRPLHDCMDYSKVSVMYIYAYRPLYIINGLVNYYVVGLMGDFGEMTVTWFAPDLLIIHKLSNTAMLV